MPGDTDVSLICMLKVSFEALCDINEDSGSAGTGSLYSKKSLGNPGVNTSGSLAHTISDVGVQATLRYSSAAQSVSKRHGKQSVEPTDGLKCVTGPETLLHRKHFGRPAA